MWNFYIYINWNKDKRVPKESDLKNHKCILEFDKWRMICIH